MPDLGPAFGELAGLFGPLLKRALGAFLQTAFGMVCFALGVSTACYFIAANGSRLHGLVAVVIALACFGIAGPLLALKRALGSALAEGVKKVALGSRIAHLLVARMLAVREEEAHGERGIGLARVAETVPLQEAEIRLTKATTWLLGAEQSSGYFRKKLRGMAVEKVAFVTLARFRDEARTHGGVNLVKVEGELGSWVDAKVLATIEGVLLKVTVLFVVVAASVALAAAGLIRAKWHS